MATGEFIIFLFFVLLLFSSAWPSSTILFDCLSAKYPHTQETKSLR